MNKEDYITFEMCDDLSSEEDAATVYALLEACDEDFVPPLSFRAGTAFKKLEGEKRHSDGVAQYFAEMKKQKIMLMKENGKLLAFLTYRPKYECEHLAQFGVVYYLTTLCVDKRSRGKHCATRLFEAVIDRCVEEHPEREITMRTWNTNLPQMHVVNKLGFECVKTLKDDRGPGVDTVYFVYRGERRPRA